MTIADCMHVGQCLLPRLAALAWSRRQAVLQLQEAAWEEKHRWQVVLDVIEQDIRKQERKIRKRLGVLKFKTKGEVF